MNKRIIAFSNKIIVGLLLAAMLMSLIPLSYAERTDTPQTVTVNTVYGEKTLKVIQSDGIWYGNIYDLGEIGNRRAGVNETGGNIYFTPSEYPMYSDLEGTENFKGSGSGGAGGRGDVLLPVLYSPQLSQCVSVDGEIYVPLQEASKQIGIEFIINQDEVFALARYTPKEVMKCVSEAFQEENYVGQTIAQHPNLWAAGHVWSTVVSSLNSKGLGLNEAFTGNETQEKYDTVFKKVFIHDDRTNNSVENIVKNSVPAKAVKSIKDFVESGEDAYEQLGKFFEIDELALKITFEKGNLDNAEIPEENIDEIIKGVKLLYLIPQLDIELIQTGNEIFESSDNKKITQSMALVASLVGDLYGVGIAASLIKEAINSAFEKAIGEVLSTITPTTITVQKIVGFIAKGYPALGDAIEVSENYQYLLVCSTIQDAVLDYYRKHAGDNQEDTTKKMRDAAIIYIKTALAFEDLYNKQDSEIERMEGILDKLILFNEYHYAPNYTNQELIDWLNKNNAGKDDNGYTGYGLSIFDGTYWYMCYGQSLGVNYEAKFSSDGTFRARRMGGGDYTDGTYEFHDGYLTVRHDYSGLGYYSETDFFSADGTEFISLEKYEMQVGEDYCRITAMPGVSEFYESGLEQNDATEPSQKPSEGSDSNFGQTQWGEWSKWQDTPVSPDANTQVETRTAYGYYYFECPHCGAHMHGWGTVCYTWCGGCGGPTPDDSGWHEVWSDIPWDEADLKDWYGTGHQYTYIDGELVFKWDTGNGGSKTQYRYRTKA